MVHTTCAVRDCMSSSRINKNVKFHQIPHTEDRRKIWINACGRPELIGKTYDSLKYIYICNLHFEGHMYAKKTLKKTAIPVLLLPIKGTRSIHTQTDQQLEHTLSSCEDVALSIAQQTHRVKKSPAKDADLTEEDSSVSYVEVEEIMMRKDEKENNRKSKRDVPMPSDAVLRTKPNEDMLKDNGDSQMDKIIKINKQIGVGKDKSSELFNLKVVMDQIQLILESMSKDELLKLCKLKIEEEITVRTDKLEKDKKIINNFILPDNPPKESYEFISCDQIKTENPDGQEAEYITGDLPQIDSFSATVKQENLAPVNLQNSPDSQQQASMEYILIPSKSEDCSALCNPVSSSVVLNEKPKECLDIEDKIPHALITCNKSPLKNDSVNPPTKKNTVPGSAHVEVFNVLQSIDLTNKLQKSKMNNLDINPETENLLNNCTPRIVMRQSLAAKSGSASNSIFSGEPRQSKSHSSKVAASVIPLNFVPELPTSAHASTNPTTPESQSNLQQNVQPIMTSTKPSATQTSTTANSAPYIFMSKLLEIDTNTKVVNKPKMTNKMSNIIRKRPAEAVLNLTDDEPYHKIPTTEVYGSEMKDANGQATPGTAKAVNKNRVIKISDATKVS